VANPAPNPPATQTAAHVPPQPARSSLGLSLVGLACDRIHELGAEAILILPDGPMDWSAVRQRAGSIPTLVATASQRLQDAVESAGLIPIDLEPSDAALVEQISLALIQAVSDERLKAGARVLVLYSGFETSVLDSFSVIRLGEYLERLTSRDLRELETSVPFETLKAVVDIAVEIGREGREGNPVGTLIVVGDAREVIERSHTLGFDPFKGYRRKERNIRDIRVREAIKEIAQLDGAFVVSRDGTVEAACRIIDAPTTGITLPKGLGTRHWAAAAITNVTRAVAVVVSQSTGNVRIFHQGEIVLRIAPMRHARAMKWQDYEAEPPPPRAERD
jgi:DNA integrity scanning protein DisA with diadenylate cyclase activity